MGTCRVEEITPNTLENGSFELGAAKLLLKGIPSPTLIPITHNTSWYSILLSMWKAMSLLAWWVNGHASLPSICWEFSPRLFKCCVSWLFIQIYFFLPEKNTFCFIPSKWHSPGYKHFTSVCTWVGGNVGVSWFIIEFCFWLIFGVPTDSCLYSLVKVSLTDL